MYKLNDVMAYMDQVRRKYKRGLSGHGLWEESQTIEHSKARNCLEKRGKLLKINKTYKSTSSLGTTKLLNYLKMFKECLSSKIRIKAKNHNWPKHN